MHLAELKLKSPADLVSFAESLNIENASSLRKQDMLFAILKNLAENDQPIHGDGTLEILPDALVEPALRETDDTVQFERQGYFRADPDGTPERPVFNRTVGLRDSWVKAQDPPKPAPKPRSGR